MTKFTCAECKQECEPAKDHSCYATRGNDEKLCSTCCGILNRNYMIEHGKITLYLDTVKRTVSNWPNSLQFSLEDIKIGNYNITGKRYDVWFIGSDNHVWHGVTYGDNTQICHCKRTKEKRGNLTKLYA